MMHYAKEALDVELIASVPKKIFAWITWLESISQEELIKYKGLHWDFSKPNEGGYVEFVCEDFIEHITWTGPITKPTEIGGSDFWMSVPSKYLELFIELEIRWYDIMQDLHDQIIKEYEKSHDGDIQTPETPDL